MPLLADYHFLAVDRDDRYEAPRPLLFAQYVGAAQ